ncbi:uncharacterized protein TrAtP1_008458 [Trichoderma atroviride]|uniref:uncharacterized protein n=1 Tax=Hypocrea atroviridis TaxID=63577 RepID=UPI00331830D4|nr:hypothetical protein TrAtP1_008458 [Trichoderma atroviride]
MPLMPFHIVVHDHELLQAPNLLEVVLFLIRASFRASLAEEELDQQRRIYSGSDLSSQTASPPRLVALCLSPAS